MEKWQFRSSSTSAKANARASARASARDGGERKCERKCEGKYEGKCEGKCEGQREGMRTSSGLLPSLTSPSRPRAPRGHRITSTARSSHARACGYGE